MMSFLSLALGMCLLAFSRDIGHIDVFTNITIFLFSAAFIFDINRSRRFKQYSVPLIAGLLFRILLLYYDVYSGDPFHLPLVGGELSSDPLGFYNAAVNFSRGNSIRYGGYFSKFLGTVFKVTGASRLLGEFIVLLFSIATIIIFIMIIEDLVEERKNKIKGVYLISLLPNYAFLSVVLRRETIITFFIALSMLFFIRWFVNKSGESAYVLAIVFALVASLFHGATGLIVASYIMVRILYSPKKKAFTLDPLNIIGAIFFVLIVMLVYSRFGATFFNKIEERMNSGVLSSTRDVGGSSYARYVGDARTPLRMLIYAVPRFLYFMFSPFPWQWRGVGDIITFLLSSCVYLLIIVDSIRYIRQTEKDDANRALIIALLIIALMSAFIFSWGVTNTGTATRHRDKFIVLYSVMFTLSRSARLRIQIRRRL